MKSDYIPKNSKTPVHAYVLLLIGSLLLAAVLRFIWLDRIPPAIGGDELTYILTAKFISLTGSDAFGRWNPWSIFLFRYPTDYPQAEITYLLLVPVVSLLKLTLIHSKLIFSALSVGSVFLVWCIAKKLFTPRVALIASYVAAVNPWSVFLGRTAYEMNPEIFFYLLSFTILLYATGKKILWALPALFCAFYSHIATKTIFIPFIMTTTFFAYVSHKKSDAHYYITVNVIALALTVFFGYVIMHQSGSRISELIRPDDPAIASTVNALRKATIPNPLLNVFTNKVTVLISILIQKLYTTVSPTYLFTNGDQFYGMFDHGLFYAADAVFLLAGIFMILRTRIFIGVLLLVMMFLSVVPHLIHSVRTDNFTPQISLFFPFAILVIAYGIDAVISRSARVQSAVVTIIVCIYVLSVGVFINNYFFQYPLRESFDFRMRVLSRYIALSPNTPVQIYTSAPEDIFSKYIFYTDAINPNSVREISEAIRTKKYSLGPVTFQSCADKIDTSHTAITDVGCSPKTEEVPDAALTRLSDAGATYKIYNDSVCQNIELTRYASHISLGDFSVENLSTQRFCTQYIHKP